MVAQFLAKCRGLTVGLDRADRLTPQGAAKGLASRLVVIHQVFEPSTATHLVHPRSYPRRVVTTRYVPRLPGVVTMSIHKLSAGSGYDYLTRQVG